MPIYKTHHFSDLHQNKVSDNGIYQCNFLFSVLFFLFHLLLSTYLLFTYIVLLCSYLYQNKVSKSGFYQCNFLFSVLFFLFYLLLSTYLLFTYIVLLCSYLYQNKVSYMGMIDGIYNIYTTNLSYQ